MQEAPSLCWLNFDSDLLTGKSVFKQIQHIEIAHADAAVRAGGADGSLIMGAMDVDVT